MGNLKNKADYSQYKCPYSHLEKECGHELQGPEGFENSYSVWCNCGFRGPVFYLEPKELNLEKINEEIKMKKVYVNHWKKGMKVKCPDCDNKSKEPYKCKEHGEFKVKVKLSI